MARFAALSLACLFFPTIVFTQSVPASDPQALAFAAQSIAALTGGTVISDVTLTGNVAWTAGSDQESGTVTLRAKGPNESRVDFVLSPTQRSEIRSGTNGFSRGEWVGNDGVTHPMADHNGWTDAVWFFPAFSSLSVSASNMVLSYVGLETRAGMGVEHILAYKQPATTLPALAPVQQWSRVDFYLDSSTLLPVALAFSTHPDSNANVNIPVEIHFANYQSVSGIQIPTHIQKYVQGTLMLDVTLTGSSVNTGLPDSIFNLQ